MQNNKEKNKYDEKLEIELKNSFDELKESFEKLLELSKRKIEDNNMYKNYIDIINTLRNNRLKLNKKSINKMINENTEYILDDNKINEILEIIGLSKNTYAITNKEFDNKWQKFYQSFVKFDNFLYSIKNNSHEELVKNIISVLIPQNKIIDLKYTYDLFLLFYNYCYISNIVLTKNNYLTLEFKLKLKSMFIYLNSMLDKFYFDLIYKLSLNSINKEDLKKVQKYELQFKWIIEECLTFQNKNIDIIFLNLENFAKKNSFKFQKINIETIYHKYKNSIQYLFIQSIRNAVVHNSDNVTDNSFWNINCSIPFLFTLLLITIYENENVILSKK